MTISPTTEYAERETPTVPKPKSCSIALGRTLTTLTSCLQNIPKISLFSLCLLGSIANPFLAAAQNITPPSRVQYVPSNPLDIMTKVKSFQEVLLPFREPGMQHVNGGSGGCTLEDNPVEIPMCKIKVSNLVRMLGEKSSFHNPVPTEEGLLGSYVNKNGKKVLIRSHINTDKHQNYKKALQHIEENFLSTNLPLPNEEQLEQLIIQTHRTLVYGDPHYEEEKPKNYRSQDIIIPFQASMEEIEKNLKHLTEQEKERFELIRNKPHERRTDLKVDEEFENNKRILHKLGFVSPVSHLLIEHEMKVFISTLIRFIGAKSNPVDLAGFIHNELVRICPFHMPSDLLARVIMNAFLVRLTGDHPVIFQSKERYLQVSYEAVLLQDFTIFSKYLKEEAIPWTRHAMNAIEASIL